MVDPYDPALGTRPAEATGPATGEEVVSLSGNVFVATSGYYFEDHYWDATCTASGGGALDAHNGHEHDGLSYHYHLTDSFPYTFGPRFAGALPEGSFARCDDGRGPP